MKRIMFAVVLVLIALISFSCTVSADFSKDFIIEKGVLKEYVGSSKEIFIPEEVIEIDADAFTNIDYYFSIYVPAKVAHLPNKILRYYCMSINVSSENEVYSSQDGVLFDKKGEVLIKFPIIKEADSYEVPQGVVKIAEEAFSFCEKVYKIVLPDSVKSIEDRAFLYCKNLSVILLSAFTEEIGIRAFYGCKSLRGIMIPCRVKIIKQSTFEDCTSLAVVKIQGDVVNIENSVFAGCSSLSSIVIPNSVNTIGSYVFSNCKNLEEIILPQNLTSLEHDVSVNEQK